jgi:ribosomal protein S18 acetylase RimI-like enzyme
LKIRTLDKELTIKNIDALKGIDQEALQTYGCLFSSENWNEDNFLSDLPGKWELSCTALFKNQPVGFCICSLFDTDKCFVYRVVVAKEYHRRHIGTEMFNFLFNRCLAREISHVLLEVNKDSKAALNFYAKLNFQKMKREDLIQYLYKKGKRHSSSIKGDYFIEKGYPEKKFLLVRNLLRDDEY